LDLDRAAFSLLLTSLLHLGIVNLEVEERRKNNESPQDVLKL